MIRVKQLLAVVIFLLATSANTMFGQLNGNYTIDQTAQATATNFVSFAAFTNALTTNGISWPVNISVAPNIGPYNEQINFTSYTGISATNKIYITGNGNYVQSNLNSAVVIFNNASYITLDSLNIKSLASLNQNGLYITGSCTMDTIMRCNIDMSSITNNSNDNCTASYINNATLNGFYFSKNKIFASDSERKIIWHGLVFSASNVQNTIVADNKVTHFQSAGICFYNASVNNVEITKNEVTRSTINGLDFNNFLVLQQKIRMGLI